MLLYFILFIFLQTNLSDILFIFVYFLFCRNKPKTFAFDHCFYSLEPGVENFASQDVVFDALGRDILDNAFQGYNACIFAYGQTGESQYKSTSICV